MFYYKGRTLCNYRFFLYCSFTGPLTMWFVRHFNTINITGRSKQITLFPSLFGVHTHDNLIIVDTLLLICLLDCTTFVKSFCAICIRWNFLWSYRVQTWQNNEIIVVDGWLTNKNIYLFLSAVDMPSKIDFALPDAQLLLLLI